MDNRFEQVMQQLPRWFSSLAAAVPKEEQGKMTELRLFAGQPALWLKGRQVRIYHRHILTPEEVEEVFYTLCQGSVHSFQQEIVQGFVTLQGGHRVGLCGTAVFHGDRQIGLKDITSLNIRFARQLTGCARELYRRMSMFGAQEGSFLIAGAPGCGKTTILRDYIRILAGGDGGPKRITAVLDERFELSGFDLGYSTHVLKGLPKEQAILQALRTLAPQVMVCDEIGSSREAELLCQGLNSGSRFLATIHASNWDTLRSKSQFQPLLQQRAIDAVVFLQGLGEIDEIWVKKEGSHAFSRLQSDFSLYHTGGLASQTETGSVPEAVAANAAAVSACG